MKCIEFIGSSHNGNSAGSVPSKLPRFVIYIEEHKLCNRNSWEPHWHSAPCWYQCCPHWQTRCPAPPSPVMVPAPPSRTPPCLTPVRALPPPPQQPLHQHRRW